MVNLRIKMTSYIKANGFDMMESIVGYPNKIGERNWYLFFLFRFESRATWSLRWAVRLFWPTPRR